MKYLGTEGTHTERSYLYKYCLSTRHIAPWNNWSFQITFLLVPASGYENKFNHYVKCLLIFKVFRYLLWIPSACFCILQTFARQSKESSWSSLPIPVTWWYRRNAAATVACDNDKDIISRNHKAKINKWARGMKQKMIEKNVQNEKSQQQWQRPFLESPRLKIRCHYASGEIKTSFFSSYTILSQLGRKHFDDLLFLKDL